MSAYEPVDGIDISWCPGCGNFPIRKSIISMLVSLGSDAQPRVVFITGIGQAAKMPHFLHVNFFNGLHGRALAVAAAVKMANPSLVVIAEGGDGDMYGEGGNHYIHTIRRNIDITHIVHNNMIYGLTKGQASPTSQSGMITRVQPHGVISRPFNPLAVALSLGATFVARTFSGDMPLTESVLKEAVNHRGYALVDVLHPCVSFNKINTSSWFKEHTYSLTGHDTSDRNGAWRLAMEEERLALGIYYREEGVPVFSDHLACYQSDRTPLFERRPDEEKLKALIRSFV
ncbi:2-oxoacid ferredoxin oxidoreductase [bacterium]|nr:2-oxoacid ferredoxin oxidoreductase [bacterium]